ncbi:MAG: DUF3108 domain-containing protein [Ottowia sp.]|uniref:DUF3108 domain-containing protein n=1 Tax=Ottowia sp. TaxID=1898956 RepID=UPI003C7132A0
MAWPLRNSKPSGPRRAAARGWAIATLITLVLHLLALAWLSLLMQPPSLLKDVATPFYTRTITPQAAEQPPPAADSTPNPVRPSVRIASAEPTAPSAAKPPGKAKAAPKKKLPKRPASAPPVAEPPETPQDEQVAQAPAEDASAAEPASHASSAPQASEPPSSAPPDPASPAGPESPTRTADASAAPASSASEASSAPQPAHAASGATPAFLASWPSDTRLRYRLGGNYRGELHGDAEVLWQRDGTNYQAVIQLDVGILLSSRFTSQGEITEGGLRPKVYEEQIRKKRRGVRLDEDVRLDNGERVPRPQDIQDAASQFVELGHRFATGQVRLQPGGQVNFWLARPGGVDEWTYDMVGEDTLYLPKLGPVPAVHLKPRPLAKPRGPITAEIWFAPSLQYLPVRIKLTSGPDTYVDLMVDTIEQQ